MTDRARAAAFAAGLHLLFSGTASAQQASEADLLDRLELYGIMQTINVDILASTSATLTLETWCDRLDLAAEPRVTVRFLPGEQRDVSAEQRQRLQVGADEPIRYRKVQLVCGDAVL